MSVECFQDDVPEEIFRLVTLRKVGGRELVHINLFVLKQSAEVYCSRVVKNGGKLISLTRYQKAEGHGFETSETDGGIPEAVLASEPYPNARN